MGIRLSHAELTKMTTKGGKNACATLTITIPLGIAKAEGVASFVAHCQEAGIACNVELAPMQMEFPG